MVSESPPPARRRARTRLPCCSRAGGPGPAGVHSVLVRTAGADLHPGSATGAIVQSVVLAPDRPRPALIYTDAAHARELCGRELEWVDELG